MGDGRLTALLVGVAIVVAGAALVALDARATYNARVSADEPQYLLTAISLGEDLDLDISDEIAAERYRSFHEVRLDPQTRPLGVAGQELSPHDPLLPALLAPAVRVGGWAGAKLLLGTIAGLTASLTVWVAVRRFHVAPTTAAVVVVAFAVSPPLVSYGTQIYPELPAAGVTMAGLAAVTGPLGRRGAAIAGLAVVALPWLAVKYVPVAAVLALAAIERARRGDRPRIAGVLVALLAVAAVGYLVIHQRVYGGWTVYASGDHFVDGEFRVIGSDPDYVGRSRRLVGLLVDRGFGLVPWAPAYMALVPALIWMARRRPAGWAPVVGVVAATWVSATWLALTMHGWWWPGRQLVVGLPAAVVAVTVLADRFRAWFLVAVIGGVIGAATWTWLAFEASTGRRALIVDFEETGAPAYRALRPLLPDHRDWSVVTGLHTGVWVVAITVLAVVTSRAAPTRAAAAPIERGDDRAGGR